MAKLLNKNWFIWITSLIPGMGLILLGKKRLGFGVLIGVGILLCVFWLLPEFPIWYILCITYIGQMAYAVSLSTILAIGVPQITPDSSLDIKLPGRFSDKKTIASKVIDALSQVLDRDEELIGAVIGIRLDTSQLSFLGVTKEHLIVSESNKQGDPSKPERILKEEITWVRLQGGESNSLLTIELENDKKIILKIPGKLFEEAKLITQEFPGSWGKERFQDLMTSFNKDDYRRGAIIVYLIAAALLILGIFITDKLDPSIKSVGIMQVVSLVFFIIGWPPFVSFVRRIKTEPGTLSINVIVSFSLLQTLFLWVVSIHSTGIAAIDIVKYIRGIG